MIRYFTVLNAIIINAIYFTIILFDVRERLTRNIFFYFIKNFFNFEQPNVIFKMYSRTQLHWSM